MFSLAEARTLFPLVRGITQRTADELAPVQRQLKVLPRRTPELQAAEQRYQAIVGAWVNKMRRLGLVAPPPPSRVSPEDAAAQARRSIVFFAVLESGAVLAGVDSIEHGTFMTEEIMTLMKERGTFWVPTILALTVLER